MEAVNGVSEVDKGGPPAPSPLTGCYLLIVVGEPHSKEHKDIILRRIAKGLLSWDVNNCYVDLEKELAIITEQAPEGEDARYGERLIQFASENLVTEILIHPAISTLSQCMKNLLSSFTRHRHIIHAGYTFAANGSWILQDGTFSLTDFSEAFQEIEVQRILRAYDNSISLDIHCSPEGDWTRLPKESFTKNCKLRINPDDVLTSGSASIVNFLNYISPFFVPADIEILLESSDVVGNIRFSHPTLYVFPGGQGDAALFGINGFNMLVDGGFARKACFWDFVRHLDRLDAVLLTRLNNSNVNGISSVLRKKQLNTVYPQIGHFFCNIQEKKAILSPDGDKDKDPLLINLFEEGQEIVSNLRQLHLQPQTCYRDIEPINLYHKVGHGTLDMYVLNPAKESKEVREFLQKWNSNDQRLFANPRNGREFTFPTQNLVSICALLVWQPASASDNITRILFPGSTPQHKIFEGLDKLKQLECIKHASCSAKTLTPSLIKAKQSKSEKIFQEPKEKIKDKIMLASENKVKLENKQTDENLKNGQTNGAPTDQIISEKLIKKHDSTESEKSGPQLDMKKIENGSIVNGKVSEEKSTDKSKPKPKPEPKHKVESKVYKTARSIERKPKPLEKKSSPTTPKKTLDTKTNGEVSAKPKTGARTSPSATPAKSAKDANNRKVVESKNKFLPKRDVSKPEKKELKERKPISRRPKGTSPVSKAPESPIKKLNDLHKLEARKPKLEKEGTTDSSTVSTPTADVEIKKDISKMSSEEIEQIKARELAELKEEQEVVKEIEAVFRKSEQKEEPDDDMRKIKSISLEDKTEGEEYLIIEKEEIEHDSLDEKDVKESEMQKHLRDSEESEKPRKVSEEIPAEDADKKDEPTKPTEIELPDSKEKEEKEQPKEVSITSPDDKKITDKDIDDENKDTKILESQPDEKFSTPIESGATTAPTLPEDERMPLDEIKEDNGDQAIVEKYVKEDTKEKEIPVVQLPPKIIEPCAKLPTIAGIRLDKQTPIRDIVKTPDEVADLPVHEEVDIENYEQYQATQTQIGKQDATKPSKAEEATPSKPEYKPIVDNKDEVTSTITKTKPLETEGTVEISAISTEKPKSDEAVEATPTKEVDAVADEEIEKDEKLNEAVKAEPKDILKTEKQELEKPEINVDEEKQSEHTIEKEESDVAEEHHEVCEKPATIKITKTVDVEKVNIEVIKGTVTPQPDDITSHDKDDVEDNILAIEKELVAVIEDKDKDFQDIKDIVESDIKSKTVTEYEHVHTEITTVEKKEHKRLEDEEKTVKEKIPVDGNEKHTLTDKSEFVQHQDKEILLEEKEKDVTEDIENKVVEIVPDSISATEDEVKKTDILEQLTVESSKLQMTHEKIVEDSSGVIDDDAKGISDIIEEVKEDVKEMKLSSIVGIEDKGLEKTVIDTLTHAEEMLERVQEMTEEISRETAVEDNLKDTAEPEQKVPLEDEKLKMLADVVEKFDKIEEKGTEDMKDAEKDKDDIISTIEHEEDAKDNKTLEMEKAQEEIHKLVASTAPSSSKVDDKKIDENKILQEDKTTKTVFNEVTMEKYEADLLEGEKVDVVEEEAEKIDLVEEAEKIVKTKIEDLKSTEISKPKEETMDTEDEHSEILIVEDAKDKDQEKDKLEKIFDANELEETKYYDKETEETKSDQQTVEDYEVEKSDKDKVEKELAITEEEKEPITITVEEQEQAILEEKHHEIKAFDKTAIETVRKDSIEISKIDKKLNEIKEASSKQPTLEPQFIKTDIDIVDKIELGRKSPKEREQDVAKIVASVAEVLKSDAPLEEFEGKIPIIPISTFSAFTPFTTELRETHITTVDSPIREEILADKMQMQPIEEEKAVPKDQISSFLDEERKIAAIHIDPDTSQPDNSRVSSLIKDSTELMQATSKIISEIKQSTKVDEIVLDVKDETCSKIEKSVDTPEQKLSLLLSESIKPSSEETESKNDLADSSIDKKLESTITLKKSSPDIIETVKDTISSEKISTDIEDILEIDKNVVVSRKSSPELKESIIETKDKTDLILEQSKTGSDTTEELSNEKVSDIKKIEDDIEMKDLPKPESTLIEESSQIVEKILLDESDIKPEETSPIVKDTSPEKTSPIALEFTNKHEVELKDTEKAALTESDKAVIDQHTEILEFKPAIMQKSSLIIDKVTELDRSLSEIIEVDSRKQSTTSETDIIEKESQATDITTLDFKEMCDKKQIMTAEIVEQKDSLHDDKIITELHEITPEAKETERHSMTTEIIESKDSLDDSKVSKELDKFSDEITDIDNEKQSIESKATPLKISKVDDKILDKEAAEITETSSRKQSISEIPESHSLIADKDTIQQDKSTLDIKKDDTIKQSIDPEVIERKHSLTDAKTSIDLVKSNTEINEADKEEYSTEHQDSLQSDKISTKLDKSITEIKESNNRQQSLASETEQEDALAINKGKLDISTPSHEDTERKDSLTDEIVPVKIEELGSKKESTEKKDSLTNEEVIEQLGRLIPELTEADSKKQTITSEISDKQDSLTSEQIPIALDKSTIKIEEIDSEKLKVSEIIGQKDSSVAEKITIESGRSTPEIKESDKKQSVTSKIVEDETIEPVSTELDKSSLDTKEADSAKQDLLAVDESTLKSDISTPELIKTDSRKQSTSTEITEQKDPLTTEKILTELELYTPEIKETDTTKQSTEIAEGKDSLGTDQIIIKSDTFTSKLPEKSDTSTTESKQIDSQKHSTILKITEQTDIDKPIVLEQSEVKFKETDGAKETTDKEKDSCTADVDSIKSDGPTPKIEETDTRKQSIISEKDSLIADKVSIKSDRSTPDFNESDGQKQSVVSESSKEKGSLITDADSVKLDEPTSELKEEVGQKLFIEPTISESKDSLPADKPEKSTTELKEKETKKQLAEFEIDKQKETLVTSAPLVKSDRSTPEFTESGSRKQSTTSEIIDQKDILTLDKSSMELEKLSHSPEETTSRKQSATSQVTEQNDSSSVDKPIEAGKSSPELKESDSRKQSTASEIAESEIVQKELSTDSSKTVLEMKELDSKETKITTPSESLISHKDDDITLVESKNIDSKEQSTLPEVADTVEGEEILTDIDRSTPETKEHDSRKHSTSSEITSSIDTARKDSSADVKAGSRKHSVTSDVVTSIETLSDITPKDSITTDKTLSELSSSTPEPESRKHSIVSEEFLPKSGKSSPEKEKSGTISPELITKDNLIIEIPEPHQTSDIKEKLLEEFDKSSTEIKKTQPEKEKSGKSSPESSLIDALTTDKGQRISGKSTPEIKEFDENNKSLSSEKVSHEVKETEKDRTQITSEAVSPDQIVKDTLTADTSSIASGRSTPEIIIDEDVGSISGKSSPDTEKHTSQIEQRKPTVELKDNKIKSQETDLQKSSSTSPDIKVSVEKTQHHSDNKVIPLVKDMSAEQHELRRSSIAGPSGSAEVFSKSFTEELELRRKSTPDIIEMVKVEEFHDVLGRTTPPTVPVSPIIKDKHALDKHEKSDVSEEPVAKMSELRSSTPGSDEGDISSGQVSRVLTTEDDEKHVYSDDEDLPGSPLSATSQIAHSTSSQYDFEESVRVGTTIDPMVTSFYGTLPDDPLNISKHSDLDFEKALQEHRETRGEDFITISSPSHVYELTTAKYSNRNLSQTEIEPSTSSIMTSSFIGTELPKDPKIDPIASWGKPLGLPSPAPFNDNKGTPKKERKIPPNVMAKNKLNEDKKFSDSKFDKKNKKVNPVYVDLTYVPHHGNSNYSYIDFFKRIRARYYVFSGIEPSKEVYNALLEAKQTWDDKELEVTIIPTYDTDVLGYWVAENEDLLAKHKIDLSPSASRCTINLQDHETSCSAYRLEFS